MDRVERTIWAIIVLFAVVWLAGFLLNAGPWIHTFVIAAGALGVFDLMACRPPVPKYDRRMARARQSRRPSVARR